MIELRPVRTGPSLAESVLDMLETGAVLLDAEHRVLCWNAWMVRASGLEAGEALGRDFLGLFPGLGGTRLEAAIREAFATGAASVLTHWLNPALLPLRRGDGRALHHSVTIRPMPGEPAACLLQVADVTAAVERERVLRLRRDARFRAVVDTASDAILTTDAAGRIEWANPAAERQFGLPAAALAGQEIGALLPEGGARWAAMAARPGADAGAPERFETTGRRADGTTMALEVSVARWMVDGHAFATGILRDVTERRQAEAALAESEARFRTIAETAHDGIWLADAGARTLYINGRMAELLGQPAAEMPGRAVADFVFPEDVPVLRDRIGDNLAGETRQFEFRFRRRDGSALHVLAATSPMRGRDGGVAGALGMFSDLTERKAAEAALAESEARLRLAQEAAGVGTWEVDLRTGLARLSPESLRMHGLPEGHPEVFDNGLWGNLLHPEDRELARVAFERAIAARGLFDLTFRVPRPDGTVCWIQGVGRVEYAEDGQPLRMLGLNIDVTAQKQVEAALREGEARFRALVEAMPQFAFSALPDGRNDFVSQGWYDYTGQEPITGEGEGWAAALHPEDLERTFTAWRQSLASGGRYEMEHRFRDRDGEHRWFLTRAVPLRDEADGRILRWFGTSTDISEIVAARESAARAAAELERLVEERTAALLRAAEERRRAEEAMRQGEKLAALGQLTGGVAHDFGNLLQVVSSGVSLLQRPALAEDRRAAVLEGMIQATQNARELIRRLLTFARQQALQPETFDLNGRLEGMSQLLRQTLGARIRVETDLAAGLWPVHADPSQFEVAVLNLAVNARDAMPEGGTLALQTRNAVLEATAERPAGDYVCLSVQDTGQGMPAAVLARVFEPFFTTKEVGKGTGLGLPQVFGFAKQSGGDIHVASAPGQGTTVTIHLPRQVAAGAAPAGQRPGVVLDALRSSGGRTILVVDDNAAAGEFAAALLEELGYATRRAEGMAAALAVLAEGGRIDAVFSDVVMPGGMSGIELAATLRATHPHIAVLLASGYSAEFARGGAPEGVEILAKPYVLDELAAALERAFAAAPAAAPGGSRPWIAPTAPRAGEGRG